MKYKAGFFFPIMVRCFGVVCLLFGLALLCSKEHTLKMILTGSFLMLLAPWFFIRTYVVLNVPTMQLTEVTDFFLFKSKSHIKLSGFVNIAIIPQLYSESFYSKYRKDITSKYTVYEIVLLNTNHLHKYKLDNYKTKEEAMKAAQELSRRLNYPIVSFNPQTSRKRTGRG